MMKCVKCGFGNSSDCRFQDCPQRAKERLRRYSEIKLPHGEIGQERIVGIVNFRGDVIIATEHRVLRMTNDEFTEVKFEQMEKE